MELHAKLVRAQLNFFKPFVASLSLETTRKGQDKLALSEYDDIAKLDLSMLTEIKRSDKGGVELKLLDRTKILAQLAQLCEGDERSAAARQLLKALDEEREADDGA